MTTYPNSPRLLKGAIISIGSASPTPTVIPFQYNPESMSRTISLSGEAGETTEQKEMRLQNPPRESMTVKVELDATDQLEKADPIAGLFGIHPQLAALELILYPKSSGIILNKVLLAAGMVEIIPAEQALILFAWGGSRVVPVKITAFSIEETEFDTKLNPIRATVTLTMNVLTYKDLGLTSVGGTIFMVHQVAKEVLATLGSAEGVSDILRVTGL